MKEFPPSVTSKAPASIDPISRGVYSLPAPPSDTNNPHLKI